MSISLHDLMMLNDCTVLPYKAKRVYFDKKLKIIDVLVFT